VLVAELSNVGLEPVPHVRRVELTLDVTEQRIRCAGLQRVKQLRWCGKRFDVEVVLLPVIEISSIFLRVVDQPYPEPMVISGKPIPN